MKINRNDLLKVAFILDDVLKKNNITIADVKHLDIESITDDVISEIKDKIYCYNEITPQILKPTPTYTLK